MHAHDRGDGAVPGRIVPTIEPLDKAGLTICPESVHDSARMALLIDSARSDITRVARCERHGVRSRDATPNYVAPLTCRADLPDVCILLEGFWRNLNLGNFRPIRTASLRVGAEDRPDRAQTRAGLPTRARKPTAMDLYCFARDAADPRASGVFGNLRSRSLGGHQ
jgi:hypothetical protein